MNGLDEEDFKRVLSGHYGIFKMSGTRGSVKERKLNNNNFKYYGPGTFTLKQQLWLCDVNGERKERVYIRKYEYGTRCDLIMNDIEELKRNNDELNNKIIYLEGLINAISIDLKNKKIN